MMTKKNNRLVIEADVTDWQEEAMREELEIHSDDDILREIERGRSTSQLARATVVARELGIAPEDILPPTKIMLNTAGQAAIISRISRERQEVTARSGAKFMVRRYVGNIPTHIETSEDETVDEVSDEGPSYVSIEDPLALDRAEKYLLNRIPGHVWTHLLMVYECGGDVEAVADELIVSIKAMVTKLA